MEQLRKKAKDQKGFTLVEIAVVMVIIGLLIGGVLKGQGMIQNAKVKNVVKQADELRAGIMGFYDKFGVYPGDENIASLPMGTDTEGDNDGQIDNNAERYGVFLDLVLANLMDGSYDGSSQFPRHAFGDDVYVAWVDPGPGNARHCIVYNNLPAEVCMEIDQKYDDGVRNTGSIAANANYTEGTTIGNFYIEF